MNIFWGGMEVCRNCECFKGVIATLDYFWRLFLNIIGLFPKVKIENWNIFGGC